MRVLPRRALATQIATGLVVAIVVAAFVHTSRASPVWYALVPLAALSAAALTLRKAWRRRALARTPFPEAWQKVLERRVRFYEKLDDEARRRFEFDVQVFLAEQTIYAPANGGGTVPVDDQTRVLIAASAAMLGHGRPDFEWPTVRDIVVYPTKFDEEYTIGHGNIAGMVHAQGPVLLSKKDLVHGFRKPSDGHNVALHELAHVLDFGNGDADGMPAGLDFVSTAPWISVVADRLRKVRDRKHVLRKYAGTNEAELFAVAVEAFFERPAKLQAHDEQLYAMLAEYFRLDPARMFAKPSRK